MKEPKELAIVIPIYKPTLTSFEQVSLDKCYSTLGHYPIYFVAPESLNASMFVNAAFGSRIKRFNDAYFHGIAGYNQLMLSKNFYQAFADYKYILIYQLDAYIFADDLMTWCKKDYDYIGAPWIPAQKYEQGYHRFGLKVMNLLGKFARLKTGIHNYYQVGNGGFSLRKVQKFLEIIDSEQSLINHYIAHKGARFHEDIFWGIDIMQRYSDFKVPGWEEALGFSFDVRPHLAFEYANNRLPIGCHGWYTQSHSFFWMKHINDYPKLELHIAK